MKLLSYNILDGGWERIELLSQVIERENPDVVGLVEADDAGVVEKIANRLGMDFIHAPGNSHASALLSRFPIRATINHALLQPGLEKSLLEAALELPDGNVLTIGVVHLHAGAYEKDESIRDREIEIVLEVFARHRDPNQPHLLCGDFNSNAPYQLIDPARCKPKTREAWKEQGEIPRRVVRRLLEAGYIDTLHAFDRAAGETAATFTTEFPGQRVDYVFGFGIDAAQIQEARVIQDAPAKDASDHYPICAIWSPLPRTRGRGIG